MTYCKIVDTSGKVIYEKTIPVSAGDVGGASTIYLIGNPLGVVSKEVVHKNTTAAFEKVFVLLVDDILRNVVFRPYRGVNYVKSTTDFGKELFIK